MSQIAELPAVSRLKDLSATLQMLILERHRSEAELNLLELRRAGFQCVARIIDSRAEFLNQLDRFRYDVVLSSNDLPGWTGLEALELLRQSGQAAPFVFVTEALGEEAAVQCFRSGATDYVLKKDREQLPDVLQRALEAKALVDARTLMIQALHLSEASSHFLFSRNPLPMCVFDRRTLEFLEMNQAALDHYGFERHEFIQMRLSDLHPADEIPRLLAAIQGDLRDATAPEKWHHTLKNSSLVEVELHFHPLEYAGRPACMMVAQNFALRRALEEQSQQVQQLEAIGRLSRGVAHDFNNAIGAIVGWAEIGEEQATAIDAKLASYFKKIHAQCDRLTALIGQLLAFTRRKTIVRSDLDLNQSVRDALRLLGKPSSSDVQIQTALAEDLAAVQGDPEQIEHALVDLLIYARDAMPAGGILSIESGNVQFSTQDHRENAGLPSGSFVQLSLTYSPRGENLVVREHTADPLVRPGSTAPCPGLMTAYGIVEQHNGRVQVESKTNRGTTFYILIPVCLPARG